MKHLLFIAAGGSIGALSRYGLSKYVNNMIVRIFPWGTLAVNITGSFLIGFFFEVFDRSVMSSDMKAFITIGFLGAYTTFSTYSLETLNLLRDGEIRMALNNILLSNVLGIAAVVLGVVTSRVLFKLIR